MQLIGDDSSIVLIGNFNPAVFHPQWLANLQIIRAATANAADIKSVHSSLTSFSAEWLRFEVIANRMIVSTLDASQLQPLRDVVVGILTVLEQTPVTMLGMNSALHYQTSSDFSWTRAWSTLTPDSRWDFLRSPSVHSVTVEGHRPDGGNQAKYVRVKLEPSPLAAAGGVTIGFNEHYEFEDTASSAERAVQVLTSQWSDAQVFFRKSAPVVLKELSLGAP